MGKINCAAIPMASAVQSDMATPALSEYGSDYLKREFLLPSMLGERVACLGVSEACAGSDVACKNNFFFDSINYFFKQFELLLIGMEMI